MRVDHRTVQRTGWRTPPFGMAAIDSACPKCDEEVLQNDVIVLVGSMVEQDEHGNRSVDLTGAQWICVPCSAGFGVGVMT